MKKMPNHVDDFDAFAVIFREKREMVMAGLCNLFVPPVVDVRRYVVNQPGRRFGPTNQGISIDLQHLPELIAALQRIEAEAKKCGLLVGDKLAAMPSNGAGTLH
jgi:hypothetical protein